LLDHRSRGRVLVKSPNIDDLPTVEPALLEHPDDVRAVTNAMQFVMDLVGRPKMRGFYRSLVQPEPGQDWATYARSTFETYWHGVGTCRMGPTTDRFAVVDDQLRVHGLENLWVVDASVLPVVPHANTNFSVILVGEVGARAIASHA
jgi:choline dehydrogenase